MLGNAPGSSSLELRRTSLVKSIEKRNRNCESRLLGLSRISPFGEVRLRLSHFLARMGVYCGLGFIHGREGPNEHSGIEPGLKPVPADSANASHAIAQYVANLEAMPFGASAPPACPFTPAHGATLVLC